MTHLRAVPGGPTGPRDPSTPPRSGSASSVRVEAPGKVNLFLSAGAPGPDGYHPLTTVFQAVRLIETVTARRQSAQDHGTVTLTLEEPNDAVPTDASNLAVRAAELLAEATGVNEGVDLLLRKRVPVAGGMAGGSADAAATLVACNALWGTNLTLPELSALAARLGADVPFSLTGATAVGSGRGDLVTPIMTRGSYHWVFALAEEGLSTPAVFRRFDELEDVGLQRVVIADKFEFDPIGFKYFPRHLRRRYRFLHALAACCVRQHGDAAFLQQRPKPLTVRLASDSRTTQRDGNHRGAGGLDGLFEDFRGRVGRRAEQQP